MHLSLLTPVPRPALLLVGTWDPFIDLHRHLLQRASTYAAEQGMHCTTIIVDPNPSAFLHAPPRWVTYDDLLFRIEMLKKYGSSSCAVLRFTAGDLNLAADDFFDLLDASLPVAELWLGAEQSLGSGHRGSAPYVESAAGSRGIKVSRLNRNGSKKIAAQARHLISSGRFAAATAIVGRPPVWQLQISSELQTSWPEGRCAFVRFSIDSEELCGPEVIARLTATCTNLTSVICAERPSQYIAFTRGNCDEGAW